DYIQGVVFADDAVSRLSYGSMMDVKSLVIAGVEAGEQLGMARVFLSSKETIATDEGWARAFAIVEEARKALLADVSRNPRVSFRSSSWLSFFLAGSLTLDIHPSSPPPLLLQLYVAGKVYQLWLDPRPKNPTRIIIERTTPKISTEVI